MNYRLSRRELRIIEETKRGCENTEEGAGYESPDTVEETSFFRKLQPYLYFALTFLIIAIALRLFVYFTS